MGVSTECYARLTSSNLSESITVNRIRIGNIGNRFIRAEADTIRSAEAISNRSDIPILRIEPIDLIRQSRFTSELLIVAVARIREPNRPVPGNDYVVHGVEVSPVEIGDYRSRRRGSRHVVYTASSCLW